MEDILANGLVGNHAYTISSVEELRDQKLMLIRIRNPWGQQEWKGKWSDKLFFNWFINHLSPKIITYSSDAWKTLPEEISKELHSVKEDGEFWIEYSDFVKQFYFVEICYPNPNSYLLDEALPGIKWSCQMIDGEWIPNINSGGNIQSSSNKTVVLLKTLIQQSPFRFWSKSPILPHIGRRFQSNRCTNAEEAQDFGSRELEYRFRNLWSRFRKRSPCKWGVKKGPSCRGQRQSETNFAPRWFKQRLLLHYSIYKWKRRKRAVSIQNLFVYQFWVYWCKQIDYWKSEHMGGNLKIQIKVTLYSVIYFVRNRRYLKQILPTIPLTQFSENWQHQMAKLTGKRCN